MKKLFIQEEQSMECHNNNTFNLRYRRMHTQNIYGYIYTKKWIR